MPIIQILRYLHPRSIKAITLGFELHPPLCTWVSGVLNSECFVCFLYQDFCLSSQEYPEEEGWELQNSLGIAEPYM